ncbi:MAG: ImmA/IrrE family metallo-endopeptidase [Gluconobacter sp.]|uniref:ImmA/IrrE family metallo-endopeptidase n=1 Tax=Gluconobacter sp. TaxID=1876758 RepID=UPI0039EAB649
MTVLTMTPEQVLSAYWERGKLPIDPEVIAKKAGLRVEDMDPFRENEEQNAIGAYWPPEKGKPAVIEIDRDEPINRVRFTLAHELGHHFLGHNEKMHRDTTKQFNIYNFDPRESAANSFAAKILMPAQYVKVLIENKKIVDLKELAKIFRVSEVAMKIRLENLNYIKP